MTWLRRILSAMICVAAIGVYVVTESIAGFVGVVFLGLLVWPGEETGSSGRKTDAIASTKEANLTPLGKARSDYAMIQNSLGLIQDREMAEQIRKLQSISHNMLQYLGKHPQRISAATQFIDYYQDRTAALVRQYIALRETGMQTQSLMDLQRDMKVTFQGFAVAYEKEFVRVMEMDVLDMNAELKVARQVMQNAGIDCNEMERRMEASAELAGKAEEPKKENGGWNLKHAGIALGGVILGAVGMWKFMGKDEKK